MKAPNLCLICKSGRNLCGQTPCPLLTKFRVEPRINKNISKDFFGPSVNIFVGRSGYPRVNMGPLAAIEEMPNLDSPGSWFGKDYSDIIELQSLVLRSKQPQGVHFRTRFIELNQELALSKKPTDVEMVFNKKPVYNMSFSDMYQPLGPSASLEKVKLAGNPSISQRTESIVTDDLKASEASLLLYKRGEDVYKITTILSSGILGVEKRRKLVPTRWSIVSVHSIIADSLIREIKQYPSINEYRVYSSQYLDNHFEVLLMPGNFEFENFEAWAPGSFWSRNMKDMQIVEEYEPYKGRTKYAESQGGGFYSSRLGCCELLKKLRRQARVIVFREIYEGYIIPLGCWQILENIRNASKQPYKKFNTKGEALKYIDSKLRLPVENYVQQSIILKQRRLSDFMVSGF